MHVLIVDDHPLYREGVKALLWGLDANTQATGAANLEEALLTLKVDTRFDLVLLDMNLPDASGLSALAAVKAAVDDVPVVILSAEEDPMRMLQAVESGAAGYIPKTTDQGVTVKALQLVMAHGIYLPPVALRHSKMAASSADGTKPELSPRQRDVLKRLLQGKSNKVIARELDIAEGTVKAHLWSAYQVLGVSTRVQAMCRVYELGIQSTLA